MDKNKLTKFYFSKWRFIIDVIVLYEGKNKNWKICTKFYLIVKSYKKSYRRVYDFSSILKIFVHNLLMVQGDGNL